MRYSTLLLAALPLASAAPVVTSVVFETLTLTITANDQLLKPTSIIVPVPVTTPAAAPAQNTFAAVAPAVVLPPSAPVTTVSTPAATPSTSSNSGSTGGSGCPIDPSAPISPGMNGNPDKSVQESVNMIRRMYNANAKCLAWSPSLAGASVSCVNAGTESKLRANSAIVSNNGGYGGTPWYKGDKATTLFENAMFTLLCQSPSDPQLAGGCAGKVGEIGCAGGACTGHHDALVDATGQYSFVGAGFSLNTKWASTSFSSSN